METKTLQSKQRIHQVPKSIGQKNIFARLKKIYDGSIKEEEYKKIIECLNKHYLDDFYKIGVIKFPRKLGEMFVRKRKNKYVERNGKYYYTGYVEYYKTKTLRQNDEEARKNKITIRNNDNYSYRLIYKRELSLCNSKFIRFRLQQAKAREIFKNIDSVMCYD